MKNSNRNFINYFPKIFHFRNKNIGSKSTHFWFAEKKEVDFCPIVFCIITKSMSFQQIFFLFLENLKYILCLLFSKCFVSDLLSKCTIWQPLQKCALVIILNEEQLFNFVWRRDFTRQLQDKDIHSKKVWKHLERFSSLTVCVPYHINLPV